MKLIDRYTKSYFVYASIMLVTTIPVLYLSVQFLVSRRIDEQLLRQKKLIINSFNNTASTDQFTQTVFLEPGIKFTTAPEASAASNKFSTVFLLDTSDHDYEPWRILKTTVYIHDKPYLLELSSSLLDKEELNAGIVVIAGLILLLFMAGLFAVNRSLSVAVWAPFYHTIDLLKKYKIEKDDILYFEKTSVEEFAELNSVIHSLTSRNADVFHSQKSFIENLSHEMQTPVAIQQAKLELLLQTEPLSEAQYRLIADLLDITQRTGSLHDSLLLLAKIDNRQFRVPELFSVTALLENLAKQYAFQADLKQIELQTTFATCLQLRADKGLIAIMLGNLLNNAIRHNIVGGSAQITCTKNSIAFTNSAKNKSLDENFLFQRFHPKTVMNDGVGLGLHIAKKIADYYHYNLHYRFKNNQHHFILEGFWREPGGTLEGK